MGHFDILHCQSLSRKLGSPLDAVFSPRRVNQASVAYQWEFGAASPELVTQPVAMTGWEK
jgi:hypothetical protein